MLGMGARLARKMSTAARSPLPLRPVEGVNLVVTADLK